MCGDLFSVNRVLCVYWCSLSIVRCLLLGVGRCVLLVGCGSLIVVGSWLFVVCCLLGVVGFVFWWLFGFFVYCVFLCSIGFACRFLFFFFVVVDCCFLFVMCCVLRVCCRSLFGVC